MCPPWKQDPKPRGNKTPPPTPHPFERWQSVFCWIPHQPPSDTPQTCFYPCGFGPSLSPGQTKRSQAGEQSPRAGLSHAWRSSHPHGKAAPACDGSAGGATAGPEQGTGGSRAAVTTALLARSEAALPRALLPLPPFLARPHGPPSCSCPCSALPASPSSPRCRGPALPCPPHAPSRAARVWPATSLPAAQGTCEQRWARRKTRAEPAAQEPLPCTALVPRLHGGPAQSPPARCRRATGPVRGARRGGTWRLGPSCHQRRPREEHIKRYTGQTLWEEQKRGCISCNIPFPEGVAGLVGLSGVCVCVARGLCVSGREPLGSAPFSAVLRVERESNWVLLV